MPPKKKVKRKPRTTNKNTNVNTQTVIVNQAPTKRKYTRRKSTTPVQPKSQFSTPESTIGSVFNLLRFIPTQQPPNYQSIQNPPQPIPMLRDRAEHIYDDDDAFSSVSGSARDFDDASTVFKPDNKPSHKPAVLSSVDEDGDVFQDARGAEEGGGGGGGGGEGGGGGPKKRIIKRGADRWTKFSDSELLSMEQRFLRQNPTNVKIKESNLKKIGEEIERRGLR